MTKVFAGICALLAVVILVQGSGAFAYAAGPAAKSGEVKCTEKNCTADKQTGGTTCSCAAECKCSKGAKCDCPQAKDATTAGSPSACGKNASGTPACGMHDMEEDPEAAPAEE